MLNAKVGTRGSRGFNSRLAESKPVGMLHNTSVQKMASRCTLLHEQAFYHKYNRGKKKITLPPLSKSTLLRKQTPTIYCKHSLTALGVQHTTFKMVPSLALHQLLQSIMTDEAHTYLTTHISEVIFTKKSEQNYPNYMSASIFQCQVLGKRCW